MPKSLFILIVLAIMSSLFAKQDIDKNFHQSYDVQPGAVLMLKHGDGNVEVTTWEKDVVDIDVIYQATFSGMTRLEPKEFIVEFEKRGEHITVVGREPMMLGLGSHRVLKYEYTIKAPSYVSLDIHGVDGNVEVTGRDGDINLRTVDGNVDLQDVNAQIVDVQSIDGNLNLAKIKADIKAETIDGNISMRDVMESQCRCTSIDGNISIDGGSGSFEASAVDGNIRLLGVRADQIDAHTSDGRIELELDGSEAPEINLKSGDGTVRVSLASGTSVKINITTGDGRIRTDLSPVSDMDMDDDLFRGSINGGGGSLRIRTGDGSVSVVER